MTQNARFDSIQRAWYEVAGNVPDLIAEVRWLVSGRKTRSRRMIVHEVQGFFETIAFGVAMDGEPNGGWDACAAMLRERIEDRLTNQYKGEFLPDVAEQLFQGYQPTSIKQGNSR